MKAVRFHEYGGSDVLVIEEVERPAAGPGQVVVRVAGTSFNPVDAAIRAGFMRDPLPLTLPHIPNLDVAGVIEELGPGVAGYAVGDAVIALLPMGIPGPAAEYVAIPAEALAPAPRTVDLAVAAALPATGLTAHQALFGHGGLTAGQRVLINGAGGSVGGFAVQLAAAAGAEVTATASPRSRERVERYGAHRVVDHTATPVTALTERFDLVLNLVRNDPAEVARLVELIDDGGTFVSTTTPGPENPGRGVRVAQVYVLGDATELTGLAELVDAGTLHIEVAERLPLAELPAVHARFERGELPGKTVLEP
ncbi:NADP-dependent oxidoreductase [Nocardia harenae]|uniref:NADP-dependent oxidoreductase n=1 Tax=Nocardia harenae TaxID=358707 RepID=UPI00082A46A9|nr:NADP-dependent oxidoreductase [Nocardia harenae]